MSEITIALDAGHGGSDSGAVYKSRKEKDDTLRLTRAVGQILENSGINVYYVREDDEYETPFKKATDANNAGADYFVSIHRNSSERPNQYNGVETLVYNDSGIKAVLARNINEELEKAGFKNLGVTERPNLVVLKRTKMPAVLIEAGFINDDEDNRIFDENFNKIAQAIADGILKTLYAQDINFNEIPDYVQNMPETVTFMCWRHSLTVYRNMRRRIPKRSRSSISWGHRSGIKQNPRYTVRLKKWQRIWLRCMRRGRRKRAISLDRIPYGRGNLKKCFRMRKRRIS